MLPESPLYCKIDPERSENIQEDIQTDEVKPLFPNNTAQKKSPVCKSILRAMIGPLILIALAGIACLLTGCGLGSGKLGLSGGGFPIGSRLVGKAVSAVDVTQPIAFAKVVVEATPANGVTQLSQMTADAKGAFEFNKILATQSGGTVILTVIPADNSFQQQRISFQTKEADHKQVLMTLAPLGFDTTKVKTVSLALASPGIASGNTASLNARLLDANGLIVNATPTLLYNGNFGALNDDGSFTVAPNIGAGSGEITAYWSGVTPQSTSVLVDNAAPQQPPGIPPPVEIGATNVSKALKR